METRKTGINAQSGTDSVPEDVAALYAWANIQGAKYRDYSASRRERRAQVRYDSAREAVDRERGENQVAATASVEAPEVQPLPATRDASELDAQTIALRAAEAAASKAAADRLEPTRKVDLPVDAARSASREERELMEAQAFAAEQGRAYEYAEAIRKALAGPQPRALNAEPLPAAAVADGEQAKIEPRKPEETAVFVAHASPKPQPSWQPLSEEILPSHESSSKSSDERTLSRADSAESPRPAWLGESAAVARQVPEPEGLDAEQPGLSSTDSESASVRVTEVSEADEVPIAVPQELEPLKTAVPVISATPVEDSATSQPTSNETVPVVAQKNPAQDESESKPPQTRHRGIPVLAVISVRPGDGASSLVAGLARALSVQGERVLLVDAGAGHSLPMYFGGRTLAPGLLRDYAPPPGTGEPITLFRPASAFSFESGMRHELVLQLEVLAGAADRVLIRACADSGWLLDAFANKSDVSVLVPLRAGIGCVPALEAAERFFSDKGDPGQESGLPEYVLTRFESSNPLHIEMRSAIRGRLDRRLLRACVRESIAIAEAFAAGATVLDHSPEAPVSHDYRELAKWLRDMSPTARELAMEARSASK